MIDEGWELVDRLWCLDEATLTYLIDTSISGRDGLFCQEESVCRLLA